MKKLLAYVFILICLLTLAPFYSCQSPQKQQPPPERSTQRIFIGTASGQDTAGIYTLQINPETGAFGAAAKFEILNPGFLTVSPDNQYLYSVNSVKGQQEGGVTAFKINSETGVLTLLNQQTTKGRGPCYISIDPSGKWVLVANYSSGSVTVLPVNNDGSLGPASDTKQHEGSSVNAERQEGPHAHYVRLGSGNLVYAADLGTDKVMLYTLDTDQGKLTPFSTPWISAAPGNGPRHIDYAADGKFVYVLNELAGSVTGYAFDGSKTFAEIQTISTIPDGFDGFNKSADIHVHPSGRFLYASNRGDYDSITVFAIDRATGKLTLVEYEQEGIVWPRNFAISPDGQLLLAANQNDNSLISFWIDQETGALTPTGQRYEVPAPICIQFETP